jgi:hypothetical protein
MAGWCQLAVLVMLSATFSIGGQSGPAEGTRFPAFDSIGALIKDSAHGLSPARLDLDVQVMVWAPTAMVPVPFLRLTHTPGGDLEANGFAWWLRSSGVALSEWPSNTRCSTPGQGTPVCVAKLDLGGSIDWGDLLADIFASRACSLSLGSGPISVTADAGDLIVRVYEPGTDRCEEYSCNAPRGDSRAGARQAARVMDVLERALAAARRR